MSRDVLYAWLSLVLALGLSAAHAQGGPPFLTDDPETPGNKHWEINFGFVGDRNPGAGDYEVPDFDINYGLGDRIQLKYELPIAVGETRSPESVNVGLGNSLLGVKWRFYEHHPGDAWFRPEKLAIKQSEADEPRVDFSVSTYPQLSLNNPTSSVRRNVVDTGPDFLLPLELNGRLGPLRLDAEVGYHFGNRDVPQSWIRGLLIGHEFTDSAEAYVEFYDRQDATRVHDEPKQREFTFGVGGRQALNKRKTFVLLLMGGRSVQRVEAQNSQPSWIAYAGLQVLLGPKEAVKPQVEQTVPNLAKRP